MSLIGSCYRNEDLPVYYLREKDSQGRESEASPESVPGLGLLFRTCISVISHIICAKVCKLYKIIMSNQNQPIIKKFAEPQNTEQAYKTGDDVTCQEMQCNTLGERTLGYLMPLPEKGLVASEHTSSKTFVQCFELGRLGTIQNIRLFLNEEKREHNIFLCC